MRMVEPGHIMKPLVDVLGLYVCNFIVHLTNAWPLVDIDNTKLPNHLHWMARTSQLSNILAREIHSFTTSLIVKNYVMKWPEFRKSFVNSFVKCTVKTTKPKLVPWMKKKLRYCSLLSLRLNRAYRATIIKTESKQTKSATIIKTESKQSCTGLLSWWAWMAAA